MHNVKTPILPTKTYEDRVKKAEYLNRLALGHLLKIKLRSYDIGFNPFNIRYKVGNFID